MIQPVNSHFWEQIFKLAFSAGLTTLQLSSEPPDLSGQALNLSLRFTNRFACDLHSGSEIAGQIGQVRKLCELLPLFTQATDRWQRVFTS